MFVFLNFLFYKANSQPIKNALIYKIKQNLLQRFFSLAAWPLIFSPPDPFPRYKVIFLVADISA